MSVNKVILLGRLGRDPEAKDFNGLKMTKFSLATSETWKDDSGEKKERTDWHDVVCFRKTAEIAEKYLSKGREVYIEGKIQTRSWDDEKTGTKKYRTEIVCDNLQLLGNAGVKSEVSGDTPAQTTTAPAIDQNDGF